MDITLKPLTVWGEPTIDYYIGKMNESRYRAQDVLKLPNVISVAGLGMVVDGALDIESVKGVKKIAAGRGFDLVDGAVARLLDQTSELGAAVDAVGDKVGLATILGSAWYHKAVPRPVLTSLALKHGASTVLTNVAAFRHPEMILRPSASGKIGMAADNIALFGYLFANAMENENYAPKYIKTARTIGRTAFLTGIIYAVPTLAEYAQRAL